MQCRNTMECYSAMKKKGILPSAATQTHTEDVMLREISESPAANLHVQKEAKTNLQKQGGQAVSGAEGGETGSCYLSCVSFQLGLMKIFLAIMFLKFYLAADCKLSKKELGRAPVAFLCKKPGNGATERHPLPTQRVTCRPH